ncbi:hypothetical protein SAMN05444156_1045 [Verrucomicrobium sp. GAS474]|uniref:peroxiredoxin family protein n=1 Tax=Verrucomicrobium sp. GAS474 TaxID=1882831 RepID=UPI00087D6FFC|nr:hypothetical protein [Verrucomicrobium sp. GAS474]SDT95582.1 hypothetical protein SAMN05444156_1045 [Verrucomicrobium sp. GAS474]
MTARLPVLLLCLAPFFLRAAEPSPLMTIPPGDYAREMGDQTLKDPAGGRHFSADVKGYVVVVIFSVPDLSQGGRQKKWAKFLAEEGATRLPRAVKFALIEDMAQSGLSGMARDEMKKEFAPKARPLLLLDETGAITHGFGIPRDRTQVLVYDKKGRLRHVETANPTPESAGRVRQIAALLLAE